MSEADAKKEHDDIQREIAESKGIKVDPKDEVPPDEEKGEDEEPGEVKEPKVTPKSKEDDDTEDDDADDEGEDVDPADDSEKPRKKSLLGKLQHEKHLRQTAEADAAKAKADLAKLTEDLRRTKTADAMKDKVKAYAEKHGMSEEAAMDLVLLTQDVNKPDESTRSVLEKSKALIQKDEASKAFETELSSLIGEIPEAADLREKIQAEAYKPENLTKSLFEIYHRLNRAPVIPKKKTGEASRGAPGRETNANTFDVKAVAAKVESGQQGALNGLSGEEVDKVFALLEKKGSRYSTNR